MLFQVQQLLDQSIFMLGGQLRSCINSGDLNCYGLTTVLLAGILGYEIVYGLFPTRGFRLYIEFINDNDLLQSLSDLSTLS